ncbi:pentapeptide repeat-containing protein [Microcoleus sp. Z1_B2]|uniref:pentapeptide repeat-containing protein n=1 Tax=Microcoleus sp. Z1_B2 TaxID=3055429 RepID=UPI004040C6FA
MWQANLQGANLTPVNLIQSPFDGVNLKNTTVAGVISIEASIKYRNPCRSRKFFTPPQPSPC